MTIDSTKKDVKLEKEFKYYFQSSFEVTLGVEMIPMEIHLSGLGASYTVTTSLEGNLFDLDAIVGPLRDNHNDASVPTDLDSLFATENYNYAFFPQVSSINSKI